MKMNTVPNVLCVVKPLVFSNDVDWDIWDSLFDSNFWMTAEERMELKAKEQLAQVNRANEEQEVAEALFGLFDATMSNENSTRNEDDVQLGHILAQTAKDIVDSDFDLSLMDTSNATDATMPSIPSDSIDAATTSTSMDAATPSTNVEASDHEIPGQNTFSAQPKQSNAVVVREQCDVILVDNEERDRREEERVKTLDDKDSSTNGNIKYTQKHMDGITGTERKKKRKQTIAINKTGRNCKQKTGGKKLEKNPQHDKISKKAILKKKPSISNKKRKVSI